METLPKTSTNMIVRMSYQKQYSGQKLFDYFRSRGNGRGATVAGQRSRGNGRGANPDGTKLWHDLPSLSRQDFKFNEL